MISNTLKSKLNAEKYNPFIDTLYYTNKMYQIHFKFILIKNFKNLSVPGLFL